MSRSCCTNFLTRRMHVMVAFTLCDSSWLITYMQVAMHYFRCTHSDVLRQTRQLSFECCSNALSHEVCFVKKHTVKQCIQLHWQPVPFCRCCKKVQQKWCNHKDRNWLREPSLLNLYMSGSITCTPVADHNDISTLMQSSKRLEKERTRLLCLAKMPFDENDMMHLRLLQTVYLNFVGGSGPVAR